MRQIWEQIWLDVSETYLYHLILYTTNIWINMIYLSWLGTWCHILISYFSSFEKNNSIKPYEHQLFMPQMLGETKSRITASTVSGEISVKRLRPPLMPALLILRREAVRNGVQLVDQHGKKQDEAHEPECRHVRICLNTTCIVSSKHAPFFCQKRCSTASPAPEAPVQMTDKVAATTRNIIESPKKTAKWPDSSNWWYNIPHSKNTCLFQDSNTPGSRPPGDGTAQSAGITGRHRGKDRQRALFAAVRRKLGSNTAAAAPSSVDSGSSTAMPQADAIKKNSAADPTNRAQRPRKQPARASARHRRAHSLDAMSRSGVFAARTRTYERNPVQGRRR